MATFGRIVGFPLAPARDVAPARTAERRGWWVRLREAWRAASSRRQLAELDDRALADLGISRAQARFEASRAPWDLRGR